MAEQPPDLDYLTRDYEGFRQLLLSLVDRAGTRWTERAVADAGVMVLEVLAAELDRLAYAGDRVGEEGFVDTARRRESVRRHAALGDYRLDRGNASQGWQHFTVAAGAATLPAGTKVAPPRAPQERPELRLVFETTEAADLDARRNELRLGANAAPGARTLQLVDDSLVPAALDAIGVRRGTHLALLAHDDAAVDELAGEVVTIRRVDGSAVELAVPIERTYLAGGGQRSARVLGNVVPIRRGRTEDWQAVGRGGALPSEIPTQALLVRRIDRLRRLRAEVEAARPLVRRHADLADGWALTNAEIAAVVEELRDRPATSLGDEELDVLLRRLGAAEDVYRALLARVGRLVPDELQPAQRVTLPGQAIELPVEGSPPLWLDGAPLLRVAVGVAGRWRAWTEVEDFLRSGPDDPHYVAEMDREGRVTLRFGDGACGALLPADSQVMVRCVVGDPEITDVGAGALSELLPGDEGGALPSNVTATINPLPTGGARVPEPLVGVGDRVRRALEVPAAAVTLDDYRLLLAQRSDVAEAAVAVPVETGRVDVVLRPAPGAHPRDVLAETRSWLDGLRLAGTEVRVRLASSVYVSIGLIVEVHPDVSLGDLRHRLKRALLDLLGDRGARILGVTRTRAEIYRVVESTAGVVWSQVFAYDLAARGALGVVEKVVPREDQIVRCLALPGQPEYGAITIRAARRYRLQLRLRWVNLDERPHLPVLQATLTSQLSGVESVPMRERWHALTSARIDAVIAATMPRPGCYELVVSCLMADEREVSEVALLADDVPILDGLEVVDAGLMERGS